MVFVSSIAICGTISVCSACLWRYWRRIGTGSPDSSQCDIRLASYWKNSDAKMGVIQEGFALPQLGKNSVCRRREFNIRTAPESLTRCGHEIPTGILERIPGVLIEVRSAIAFCSLVTYTTSNRRSS